MGELNFKLTTWSKILIVIVVVAILAIASAIFMAVTQIPKTVKNYSSLENAPKICQSLAQFDFKLKPDYKVILAVSNFVFNTIELENVKLNEQLIFFWNNNNIDPQKKLELAYKTGVFTPKFEAKFVKKGQYGRLNVANETMYYQEGVMLDNKTKKQFAALVGCIKLKDTPRVITVYDCQFNNSQYILDQFKEFLSIIKVFNYNFNKKNILHINNKGVAK